MDTKKDLKQPMLEDASFFHRHKLLVMLISVIVIALILTLVSVSIYSSSGAAQLDLSRPGYKSVSNKVERSTQVDQYPSTGPVTPNTIKEFLEIFSKQSGKTRSVDAFSGDPLNPEVLVFGSSEDN